MLSTGVYKFGKSESDSDRGLLIVVTYVEVVDIINYGLCAYFEQTANKLRIMGGYVFYPQVCSPVIHSFC